MNFTIIKKYLIQVILIVFALWIGYLIFYNQIFWSSILLIALLGLLMSINLYERKTNIHYWYLIIYFLSIGITCSYIFTNQLHHEQEITSIPFYLAPIIPVSLIVIYILIRKQYSHELPSFSDEGTAQKSEILEIIRSQKKMFESYFSMLYHTILMLSVLGVFILFSFLRQEPLSPEDESSTEERKGSKADIQSNNEIPIQNLQDSSTRKLTPSKSPENKTNAPNQSIIVNPAEGYLHIERQYFNDLGFKLDDRTGTVINSISDLHLRLKKGPFPLKVKLSRSYHVITTLLPTQTKNAFCKSGSNIEINSTEVGPDGAYRIHYTLIK